MAQCTESLKSRPQSWNQESSASVPLPSSKGLSLVSERRPSPPVESIETDLPVVAINYSSTTLASTLPQRPFPPLKHLVPTSNFEQRETAARDVVLEKSVLTGLGFGLGIGTGEGGSDLGVKAQWHRRPLGEPSEDGSDLGLINVSPIFATSSITSPTEEKFVNATAHLRQHSGPAAREEILEASLRREEEFKEGLEKRKRQMRPSIERSSSEEVMDVPDLRPEIESAAEARRRRRRLERRQTPMNSLEPVQRPVERQWGRQRY